MDLAISDVTVVWEADAFRIETVVGIGSFGTAPVIDAELRYYIDGSLVEIGNVSIGDIQLGTCYACVHPFCDGDCPDLVVGSTVYYGSCTEDLVGAGVWRCVCYWYADADEGMPHPYTGQVEVRVVIDEDGLIDEYNEFNNEMNVLIEPPPPQMDLSVADIQIGWEADGFRIQPVLDLGCYGTADFTPSTVSYYVDGDLVEMSDFWIEAPVPGSCYLSAYPACDGACPDIFGLFQWYDGFCTDEYMGAGFYRCVCHWSCEEMVSPLIPYSGQSQVRVVVDEQGIVPEYNEDNNEMVLPLSPTATVQGGDDRSRTTWSRVKTTYR